MEAPRSCCAHGPGKARTGFPARHVPTRWTGERSDPCRRPRVKDDSWQPSLEAGRAGVERPSPMMNIIKKHAPSLPLHPLHTQPRPGRPRARAQRFGIASSALAGALPCSSAHLKCPAGLTSCPKRSSSVPDTGQPRAILESGSSPRAPAAEPRVPPSGHSPWLPSRSAHGAVAAALPPAPLPSTPLAASELSHTNA